MRGLSKFIVRFENVLYPFRVLSSYASRITKRIGGKRFAGLTTAGKVALLYFACMATFISMIWVGHIFFPDRLGGYSEWVKFVDGWFSIHSSFFAFFVAYLIAFFVCTLVYWAFRLATLEMPTLYPEIDQCWEPMEAWREKQNLEWNEFKRFLVLGPDLEVSKAMHAEMKNRKIGPLPAGNNEWMHWFGTVDSVYLHLKEVCNASVRMETLGSNMAGAGNDSGFRGGETLQVSADAWSASPGIDDVTAEVDSSLGASAADFGGSLDPVESLDPYDSAEMMITDIENDMPNQKTQGGHGGEDELGEDGDTPRDRIQYLARLMRSKTGGEMPFHGILVVIPFDKFIAKENHKAITEAVKRDLLEIRRTTEVSVPVSFVFASMEKDLGFPKLQNLLGSQRAKTGRFGAGCRVESVPVVNEHNLSIQISRACKSFETWVMNRWGKSSQLSRAAQNKELYKMVMRIRQQFRPKLKHMFENALIWKPSEAPDGEGSDLPLAGCYFVSTGERSADRGFLSGVFLKCEEFAETASWSEDAVNRDRVLTTIATFLFAAAFLAAGLAIFIINQSQ